MKYIQIRIEEYVAVLTICREEALNALNDQVMHELSEALDEIDRSKCRCVVITGAGNKAFIAGADIGDMSTISREESRKSTLAGLAILDKLEHFRLPVIAAVNGYALGGGCELALCCDIRLASENAQLGFPETSLGIIPGYGGTQRLPRLVSVPVAKELIYSAWRIDAQEAYRIGLVNHVYPADQLMEEALRLAHRIAKNAPLAVQAAKRAINDYLRVVGTSEGIGLELDECNALFGTKDQQNAMQAFVEKRKHDPFVGE